MMQVRLSLWAIVLSCWVTQAAANPIEARVVGITDGDTITVLDAARQQKKIKLAEIDAPEQTQAFGTRSKQHLSEICFGKEARIEIVGVDRYGRLIGKVECDGVSANRSQVASGLAWAYRKYLMDASLLQLEGEARAARRGLWAGTDPVPPWEWRKLR